MMFSNLYNTIHPPKIITIMMVTAYITCIAVGVLAWSNLPSPRLDPIVVFATITLVVGGIVGAASCWVGAYWLEGPASIIMIYGVALVALSRLALVPILDHFPITILLAVTTGILFGTRVYRIWPYMYRGQADPKIQAEVKAALAKEESERLGD